MDGWEGETFFHCLCIVQPRVVLLNVINVNWQATSINPNVFCFFFVFNCNVYLFLTKMIP